MHFLNLLIFSISVGSVHAQSVSIGDVLKMAEQKSETIHALNLSIESLEAEIRAREIVLSPTVSSELAVFRDSRQVLDSTTPKRTGNSGLVDVTLTAPFSTGTTFTLTAGHDLMGGGPANTPETENVSDWQIRISQSLWNDAFGRSTRLRRQAEAFELKARRLDALFQRQTFFNEVESAYWDMILALKVEALVAENLQRNQSLEKWSRGRFSQYAAEATDLLQVQALLSSRRLDQVTATNDLELAKTHLRQLIPGVDPATWKLDIAAVDTDRDPMKFLFGNAREQASPRRMDALSADYAAQQAAYLAKRADDQLNPTLDLYASYAANGIDPHSNEAWDESLRAESTWTQVGVVFSTPLDWTLKNQSRKANRLSAQAQTARAEGLSRAAGLAWTDLLRNVGNLRAQIKEARVLADIQTRKVSAERKRFQSGRTTTLEMTTYEFDATDSELRLYQLQVGLRKAESSARVFTYEGDG